MKKIIVFFGIDGTGKTSLIKSLQDKFSEKGESSKVVYMGVARERKIPLLGPMMDIYSKIRWCGKSKKTTYSMRRDAYRERNFFWLLVYYMELLARYISFKRISKTKYILCDRYFYDGLVFAEGKNFKLFRRLIPKPDICFLLSVPPEVIMKRKNEAESKDILRFYKKADLIAKYFDIKRIDNTKKIEKVVEEIYRYIQNEK